MTAPNIKGEGALYGRMIGVALSTTSPTVVLNNPASSGKLLRVNGLRACNKDPVNSCNVTLELALEDDGGGTKIASVYQMPVPAGASVDLLGRDFAANLEEDSSLVVTAENAGDLDITGSYDEIN